MSASTISSTPMLRAAFIWGLIVAVVIGLIGAVTSGIIAGEMAAISAATGAAVAAFFGLLTPASFLIGNRFYGQPAWLQTFFAIVMGGWLLKFVLVIVAVVVLTRQDWVVRPALFFTLVAVAIAQIVVDLVVMQRMRIPAVSDIRMPGDDPAA